MHVANLVAVTRRPAQIAADLEYVVAPACALALLLHPSPLTWPAVVVGSLPSLGRLVTTGRPWRETPFDLGIGLFAVSVVVGMLVTLAPGDGAIRLAGLGAALMLFGWAREHATTPRAVQISTLVVLGIVAFGAALMVHIAAPFLRLDRVPPLAVLANLMEPLGLYRLLAADAAALQRFRLYASGTGAVAAVGLTMTVGLMLSGPRRRRLLLLGCAAIFFGTLLIVSDNRGSMIAAALAIGGVVVWWRPRLTVVAGLVVFGTLDLIALGVVQRGLDLRTVVERLDFWQKGLLLARETPFTGVGLGVGSVQLVYRAAFQPAYPPFSHAHNIFVQGLLEQGIVGLAGLVLLTVASLRLGVVRADAGDPHRHAASLALFGGTLALIAAGLTEIVALTTVGGALLFGLLGLLVAAHDGVEIRTDEAPVRAFARRALTWAPRRRAVLVAGAAFAVGVLFVAGGVRPLAAVPLLNAGTTALYRATLREQVGRAERGRNLGLALSALRLAATVDPSSGVIERNLGLAYAANGERGEARRAANLARARTADDDADGLFGVGRAYAAAGDYAAAIGIWQDIGAGPQLMRLGRQLSQGPAWEMSVAAFNAAVTAGAPPRPAADAIARASLAHGESTATAVERLAPLVRAGGNAAYNAHLQIARLYRIDGQLGPAERELQTAGTFPSDEQLALELGLVRVWAERYEEAEPALRWAVEHRSEPPLTFPDGDDPHYWLAYTLAKLGRHDDAIAVARPGLAALPDEQSSLRVPYQVLLGESLLATGRREEARAAFRAGARLAPTDPRIVDGLVRVGNASH
jgi:tetratricopeptide (TPR) repeat protein/O-antigen ligase